MRFVQEFIVQRLLFSMDASGTAGLAEGSNDFSELGLKEARDAGSAAFASGDFQRAGKLFVAAAEADLRRSDDQSNDSPDAKTRSPSAAARLYNNGSLAFYLAGDFPSSLEAARRSKDFDPSCAKGKPIEAKWTRSLMYCAASKHLLSCIRLCCLRFLLPIAFCLPV